MLSAFNDLATAEEWNNMKLKNFARRRLNTLKKDKKTTKTYETNCCFHFSDCRQSCKPATSLYGVAIRIEISPPTSSLTPTDI